MAVGGAPHADGFVVQPGAGIALGGPVLGPLDLMLTGDRTGGTVTAFEHVVAPGGGPPLHLHEAQDEVWRVLDGTIRFRIGDELTGARRGAWAFVPRGTPHCFQNIGEDEALLAVLLMPAGLERFFVELAALSADDVGTDTVARLGAPSGMVVLGPPLSVSHPR
jgi:mannose-6-phosphate isomerase-like protein (cupin superfamily)